MEKGSEGDRSTEFDPLLPKSSLLLKSLSWDNIKHKAERDGYRSNGTASVPAGGSDYYDPRPSSVSPHRHRTRAQSHFGDHNPDLDPASSLYLRRKSVGVSVDNMSRIMSPRCVVTRLSTTNELEQIKAELGEPDEDEPLPTLSSVQKMTIVMLSIANLSSCIVFSCIAPFFPQEATDKGVSSTVQGFIFGVFELTIFVFSPIFGRLMTTIGPKFLFTAGLCSTGVTSVLFGFLNLSRPGVTFATLCFIVRIFQAIGDAAFITASFSIVASQFPRRTATLIGWLETFTGLGYMGGPTIGGFLYEAGGFQLPFLVLGLILVLSGILSAFLLKDLPQEQSETKGSFLKLMMIPTIIVMLLTATISSLSLSFFDPTLEPFLATYGLSPFYVGLFFLVISVVYTVSAPFWGWFLDRKGYGKQIMCFGTGVMVIAFMIVGPSPIFGYIKNLWIVGISLALFGIGIGAQLIPPFSECLNAARSAGYEENFATFGIVSGLFQGASSLGAFLGPTLGGIVSDAFGFEWAATGMAFLHFIALVVLIVFIGCHRRHRLRRGLQSLQRKITKQNDVPYEKL